MGIEKVRGLAQHGIVTDVDPYDLPLGAWSGGVNVRFVDGRVERGPVFRGLGSAISATPRFLFSNNTGEGGEDTFTAYKNGQVKKWSPATGEADYSIAAYVTSDSESTFTAARLQRCMYVNREDRVPWALTPASTAFAALANWNSAWRCKVLRPFNDSLVALNVTKSGVAFPTMVKTSDFATDGTVPPSWDETSTTNNAYENVVSEMKGQIIDGLTLKSAFFIYSNEQTWAMTPTLDTNIYRIEKVFDEHGIINTNCVIEVNGVHYCFGPNDLWKHDGIQPVSIADGRVRKFVFNSLNANNANRCFVQHNPVLKEIMFCFVSGDRFIGFQQGSGCNRAAVLNYGNDTWTFYDLPSVFASTSVSVSNTATWETVTGTWDNTGSSWTALEGGYRKRIIFIGESVPAYTLGDMIYGFDVFGAGAVFSEPVTAAATPGLQLERSGIDLDEVNEELRGYKTILAIYPQGRVDTTGGAAMEFSFGASDGFNEDVTYSAYQTYDGVTEKKLDFKDAGAYLAMRMRYLDYRTASLSGLDLDMKVHGRRGS